MSTAIEFLQKIDYYGFSFFNIPYFDIVVIISDYILVFELLINKNSHSHMNIIIFLYVLWLGELLYDTDMGFMISNYDMYKHIILMLLILFALCSVLLLYIYFNLEERNVRFIINPSSFHMIIFFVYLSLMILSLKLIPQNIPALDAIKGRGMFYDTLDIIPLFIIQMSFIISIFKVENVLKSKVDQHLVNYYILSDKYQKDQEIFNKDNLIKHQRKLIENLQQFILLIIRRLL